MVSALLQAAAFIFPQYLYWISFFALIPLFIQPVPMKAMKSGFVWGIVFFAVGFLGLLPFLYSFGHGVLRYVPYLILVAYFSTLSGCWFVCAQYLSNLFHHTIAWALATILYAGFLYYVALLPLGQFHGIPLFNPLVPLAECPVLVYAASYIGVMGLTMVLIGLQACIAYGIVSRTYPIVLGIFIVPFVVGFFVPSTSVPTLTNVGYLKPTGGNHSFPCDVAGDVAQRMKELCKRYPQVKFIVLPEGAFRFPLHKVPAAVELLAQESGDIELIFGSHRTWQGNYYNCMYRLYKGILQHLYDKELCVPFAEYVPAPWARMPFLSQLFLDGYKSLTPSSKRAEVCSCAHLKMIPQICYDLYFRPFEPGGQAALDIPILLLTNDGWYPVYLQHLLFLLARLRAIAWGRDIWYIAHTGGWWLGKCGRIGILQTLT